MHQTTCHLCQSVTAPSWNTRDS